MCLPPAIEDPKKYFFELKSLALDLSLKELRMGMSNDYLKAANCGSSYLENRIKHLWSKRLIYYDIGII